MAIAKQRVGKHVPAATNMLVEMKALPQDWNTFCSNGQNTENNRRAAWDGDLYSVRREVTKEEFISVASDFFVRHSSEWKRRHS
jgi:hypothetical protein